MRLSCSKSVLGDSERLATFTRACGQGHCFQPTQYPEMHSSQKGKQWHFGMKAHIGVDADSGLVHTVRCTSGNQHDITQAHRLLHGQEMSVWAAGGSMGEMLDKAEKLMAGVRAKVEHPFRVIKRQFGFVKVRYKGLAKNAAQIATLFALSNLWMARQRLMAVRA